MRKPNTHECAYYGRKMSNIICNDSTIESPGYYIESEIDDFCIGSELDDVIDWDSDDMIKERVKIILHVDDEGCYRLDLEDILKFAKRHCSGIYKRVDETVDAAKWEV